MIRKLIGCLLLLGLLSSCGVVKVKKPPAPSTLAGPLKSTGFEDGNAGDGLAGWRVGSSTNGEGGGQDETPTHKIELTKSQKHGGKMSAVFGPVGKEKLPKNLFGGAQLCGDSPFPGSAFKASAFIKGDPAGTMRFMVSQFGSPITSIQKRAARWTRVELFSLAPIPNPAPADPRTRWLTCIHFGVTGSSRAWIDDLKFEKADLAFPSEKVHPVAIDNLDMERFDRGGTLANWTHMPGFFTESDQPSAGYQLRADRRIKRSGAASLQLTAEEPPLRRRQGDTASQCVDPTAFHGKTMRLSGWLKADVADDDPGREGSSIGIVAAPVAIGDFIGQSMEELEEFPFPPETTAAEMGMYPAADWIRHELILFIPKATVSLCIQVRLDQVGSVWADDLSVEVIDL